MLSHKECNPGMLEKSRQPGGLRLDEWKVQMGLSQSDLRSIPESIQAAASSDSRRVLSGLQLQPQIRHSIAQWPSAATTQDDRAQRASANLWRPGDLRSDGDLGSRRLSLLGQAQSALAAVAAVGDQTLGADGPSAKATAADQPLDHGPAAEGKETPTEKTPVRAHQARHLAQTPHPDQNRLLGCPNSRLYRGRSSLAFWQLGFRGVFALAQCHRHPLHLGGKPCSDGEKPDRVLNAMQDIEQALPFKLLGIDSDNGSEFINYHLKTFCDQNHIQLTRGRPYKKDDNAHIEQKNYTHVRKILGYLRYDSQPAQKAINELYQNELRILQNLFLPAMKLIKSSRIGSSSSVATTNPRLRWTGCSVVPKPIRSKSSSLNGCATKPIPLSWPNAWSTNLSASLSWPTRASVRNPKIPLAHPRLAVKYRLSARSPRSLDRKSQK